jgi:hypothetical protein
MTTKISLKMLSKYYYVLFNNNNINIIKSDSSNDGKLKIINKLKTKKNTSIIRINFKKVTKKMLEKNDKSQIKIIGGPVYAEIHEYLYNKDKLKTIPIKPKNIVYFSETYFVNFNKINLEKDIVKMATKYINNKFPKSLLQIVKIHKL